MSDLIDRSEAKEALRERLKRIPTYAIWAMHTIDELPTRSTPSNTLGALDCVSREDLTKGIETYFGDLPIVVHYDMLALAQRLPSVQPEEVIPHRNYKYLSDYWCECGNHLGKKGEVKYCSDCGRKVKWDE